MIGNRRELVLVTRNNDYRDVLRVSIGGNRGRFGHGRARSGRLTSCKEGYTVN